MLNFEFHYSQEEMPTWCHANCYFEILQRFIECCCTFSRLFTTCGSILSALWLHLTPNCPVLLAGIWAKKAFSPLAPPKFNIPIGIPLSCARFTSLHAEYVARLLPITKIRPAVSIASSAAIFTSALIDSPNMMTAGLRTPAFDEGNQAPSASTSTRAFSPFDIVAGASARHVGQAGYRNVL